MMSWQNLVQWACPGAGAGGSMTKRLQKGPAGLEQSRGQTRLRPNKAETRQTKRLVIVFYGVQNQMQKRNEKESGQGSGKGLSNWDKLEIKWMKMNSIIKSCQPEMRWIRIIYTNDYIPFIYIYIYIYVTISKPCLAHSHSYSLQFTTIPKRSHRNSCSIVPGWGVCFCVPGQLTGQWKASIMSTTKSEGDRPPTHPSFRALKCQQRLISEHFSSCSSEREREREGYTYNMWEEIFEVRD